MNDTDHSYLTHIQAGIKKLKDRPFLKKRYWLASIFFVCLLSFFFVIYNNFLLTKPIKPIPVPNAAPFSSVLSAVIDPREPNDSTSPAITNDPAVNSDLLQLVYTDTISLNERGRLLGWSTSTWSSARFEIVTNDGYNDNCSLKITMDNYVAGDAKWMFEDISLLVPGQNYYFNMWYKTDAIPRVVARYRLDTGNYIYLDLPALHPEDHQEWQYYSGDFVVPEKAVSTTIFALLEGNGYLQTDAYSIAEFQHEGWDRPLLTITFDDGDIDNVFNALPILEKYELPATHFYLAASLKNQEHVDALKILAAGKNQEIASHGIDHLMLSKLDEQSLISELVDSKRIIGSVAQTPIHAFAAPYGLTNELVISIVEKNYNSNRGNVEGYNGRNNFDLFDVRVRNIFPSTSAEELATWIEKAQTEKTWLILLYHRIADSPNDYGCSISQFEQHMKTIADSGILTKTYSDGLKEICAQQN